MPYPPQFRFRALSRTGRRHKRTTSRRLQCEVLETRRLLVAEGDVFTFSDVFDAAGLVGNVSSTIRWGDGVTTSATSVSGGNETGNLAIRFDYSLDTNNFFRGANVSRQTLLQSAADSLIKRFSDDLSRPSCSGTKFDRFSVPAGSQWVKVMVHFIEALEVAEDGPERPTQLVFECRVRAIHPPYYRESLQRCPNHTSNRRASIRPPKCTDRHHRRGAGKPLSERGNEESRELEGPSVNSTTSLSNPSRFVWSYQLTSQLSCRRRLRAMASATSAVVRRVDCDCAKIRVRVSAICWVWLFALSAS